jgi:hypothetical protein
MKVWLKDLSVLAAKGFTTDLNDFVDARRQRRSPGDPFRREFVSLDQAMRAG